jgi:hypothetical protein
MKVTYRVMISGLPVLDENYWLSATQFGESPRDRRRLGPWGPWEREPTITVERHPRGAPYELALMFGRETVLATARVIPFPIEARHGGCRVWLELLSPAGDRFTAHGEGFQAGEAVRVLSRSNGEAMELKTDTRPDGSLTPSVLVVGTRGQQYAAGLTVYGKFCTVSLDYQWGAPALKPQ